MKIQVYKRARVLEGDSRWPVRSALPHRPGFRRGRWPQTARGRRTHAEGRYFICTKNAGSRFFRALGVSYPNAQDARAACERGEIDAHTCRDIERADREGRRPDWNTPLGGLIMLHGEHPEGCEGDWTAGCVALQNGDMARLFAMCALGDSVEIHP